MIKIEYKGGDYLQCDYGKWININEIIQIESYYDYKEVRGTAKPAPKRTRLVTPTECIILDIEPKEFINLINLRKTQEKIQYFQAIENICCDIIEIVNKKYKNKSKKKWK